MYMISKVERQDMFQSKYMFQIFFCRSPPAPVKVFTEIPCASLKVWCHSTMTSLRLKVGADSDRKIGVWAMNNCMMKVR